MPTNLLQALTAVGQLIITVRSIFSPHDHFTLSSLLPPPASPLPAWLSTDDLALILLKKKKKEQLEENAHKFPQPHLPTCDHVSPFSFQIHNRSHPHSSPQTLLQKFLPLSYIINSFLYQIIPTWKCYLSHLKNNFLLASFPLNIARFPSVCNKFLKYCFYSLSPSLSPSLLLNPLPIILWPISLHKNCLRFPQPSCC